MLLIGYLSALSCRAGETVDVMVSGSQPSATIDLVRVLHGDENPAGPGFLTEEIAAVAPITVPTREVATPIGSYGCSAEPVALGTSVTMKLSFWPTAPALERPQTLVSLPGVALDLAIEGGRLVLRHAGRTIAACSVPLLDRCWYAVQAEVGPEAATIAVVALLAAGSRTRPHDSVTAPGLALSGESPVLLAASTVRKEGSQRFAADLYNGKIAGPVEILVDGKPTLRWRLEDAMAEQSVPDETGAGCDLVLTNVPTRAMTGPRWTGRLYCWEQDPTQYDAIHFHDDDLSDACWPVSAQLTIPADLASGVYTVRLRADGAPTDHIPLAVRPGALATPAKIALVLGTYTYVAYANEHLTEGDFEQASEIPVRTGIWEELAARHHEWGKSVYDLHSDGSGVAHATALRPIPNMRPNYVFWGFGAPRRFSADLYIVYFLHHLGLPFDILTEHDLQAEATTVLRPYQTVLTSTHPEYYSAAMLDAYEAHVERGGGLLYQGGDGFYWVTTPMPGLPDVIEVRKSEGLRHWDADPGERYHAGTGELGGLWRSRGRSPHKLFGVGMAANGWDRRAPGYRRTPASYRDDVAWVFDGIAEEVVGDFGLIMNGTSGDEIDRIDYRHGTPRNTVVLASSEPHSEWYVPVPEDVTTVSNQLNGTYNRNVRSDMVLIEHETGGAVFAVGSIIFAGALPVNDGDNNVARLLANIVRNFTDRDDGKAAFS